MSSNFVFLFRNLLEYSNSLVFSPYIFIYVSEAAPFLRKNESKQATSIPAGIVNLYFKMEN